MKESSSDGDQSAALVEENQMSPNIRKSSRLRHNKGDKTISFKDRRNAEAEKRGLVYVGHIPHGFYEDEMKQYFKQFGSVTNAKVCRSRRTGNSKGYGYVEFSHPEVAKIAAETMNNYLMFKKRLIVEFVPHEKRPRRLFQGKASTQKIFSAKTRRGRQISLKNRKITDSDVAKKVKSVTKKFNRRLASLSKAGIKCDVQPLLPDSTPSAVTHQADPFDSEVEFKLPKAPRVPSSKALLAKSLDSVRTLLEKNSRDMGRMTDENQSPEEKKNKMATIKNKKKNGRGVSKREKKPAALNSETMKKIARELIRKRGNPLVNVLPTKQTKRKQ